MHELSLGSPVFDNCSHFKKKTMDNFTSDFAVCGLYLKSTECFAEHTFFIVERLKVERMALLLLHTFVFNYLSDHKRPERGMLGA